MTGPRSQLKKDLDRIAVRVSLGDSLDAIAAEYQVKRNTVRDYLHRAGYIVPRRRELRPHGTSNRYDQGCRCMACRAANTRVHKRARVGRLGKTPPSHGESTYSNWGCRCAVCREEHAKKMARNHRRRQERRGAGGGAA